MGRKTKRKDHKETTVMDLTKDDVDILTYIINDTIEYIRKKGVDTELNFYGGLIR